MLSPPIDLRSMPSRSTARAHCDGAAKSVGDRAKQLSVVLRREVTKIRSFEAEHAQARKTIIFSEVSMTDLFVWIISLSVSALSRSTIIFVMDVTISYNRMLSLNELDGFSVFARGDAGFLFE